jgi:rhodanese-related sulfurtransferase
VSNNIAINVLFITIWGVFLTPFYFLKIVSLNTKILVNLHFKLNQKHMKSILKLPLLLFISLLAVSCNGQEKTKQNENSKEISVISPNDFLKMSKRQLVVDVRTPKEYNEGHLENALNINFYDENFLDQFANYSKEEPIYIYCRSGGRSGKAAKKLSKLGFKKVYDLQGGYLNWTAKNHKIVE